MRTIFVKVSRTSHAYRTYVRSKFVKRVGTCERNGKSVRVPDPPRFPRKMTCLIEMADYESELVHKCISWLSLGPLGVVKILLPGDYPSLEFVMAHRLHPPGSLSSNHVFPNLPVFHPRGRK